jgi:hypothetical protein
MERDHLEDPHVDGRIMPKWIFSKWDGEAWTGLLWLRIGVGGGCLFCSNKPFSSVICRELLDYLRT